MLSISIDPSSSNFKNDTDFIDFLAFIILMLEANISINELDSVELARFRELDRVIRKLQEHIKGKG